MAEPNPQGSPEPGGVDPQRLRVSDADRHAVAEILRDAAGAGRLDGDELDERLEAAYAAKTYADLVPLTADLPGDHLPAVPPPADRPAVPRRTDLAKPGAGRDLVVPGPEQSRHAAVMSAFERRGPWVVPKRMTVVALMGGTTLDLREARYADREVVLTIHAVMGGGQVIVGPDTHVVMEGTGIMGGFSGPHQGPSEAPDPVTVRVRGVAFWGGVSVERKPV